MKIKVSHFEAMKKLIWNKIYAIVEEHPAITDVIGLIELYEQGKFPRSEKVKDLQKRFCFDLWLACGGANYAVVSLYDYLDDSHIYTALKAICPTVTRKY